MLILIVEDDPMIGRALATGLQDSGYAADWVRDGSAAELALRQGGYDLAPLALASPCSKQGRTPSLLQRPAQAHRLQRPAR